MVTRTRVVSVVLAVVLLAGPLVPVAGAQQPGQPAPPPQPELFQETLRAEQDFQRNKGAYDAGAAVTNVFLVPGRAITCVVGGIVGVAVLAATFGNSYRAAADVWREGCGGKWYVTGEDLRPETPTGRLEMERY